MHRLRHKFIWILVFSIILASFWPTTVSAKGKTGFYVGGESNVRRVAIKKIAKKYVYFDMAYSGLRVCVAKNIKADLKKNGKFEYKDDWGGSGSGVIKISSKYIKIKVKGYSMCSTNDKWRKLKRVSNSKNIMTVY